MEQSFIRAPDILERSMGALFAIFPLLFKQAANNNLLYQDDTHHPILEKIEDEQKRKGVYISGFLSKGEYDIALFFPGHQHAGENFDDLMQARTRDIKELIRMSDALNANHDH